MIKQTRVSHPSYNLLTTEIEVFDSLAELALEMHWSWEHSTGEVWRRAESQTVGNHDTPWVVLQTVLNDLDRFDLVLDVLHRLPQEGNGITLKKVIEDKLIEHKAYIDKHGQDMPEILNWKWQTPPMTVPVIRLWRRWMKAM